MNARTAITAAASCLLSGFPQQTVTTTFEIFVVLTNEQEPVDLVRECTLAKAQDVARFARDKTPLTGVRLTRETRSTSRTEFVHDEHAEMYGDALGAGCYDEIMMGA